MKEDLSFPTLLAGPILRRAEPERVCIWIASSKPVSMRAEIFRVDDLKKLQKMHIRVKLMYMRVKLMQIYLQMISLPMTLKFHVKTAM
jgi:hypothetical protein